MIIDVYCIATYCPLATQCQRCKSQTSIDYKEYMNFSGELRASINGWLCPKFILKDHFITTSSTL